MLSKNDRVLFPFRFFGSILRSRDKTFTETKTPKNRLTLAKNLFFFFFFLFFFFFFFFVFFFFFFLGVFRPPLGGPVFLLFPEENNPRSAYFPPPLLVTAWRAPLCRIRFFSPPHLNQTIFIFFFSILVRALLNPSSTEGFPRFVISRRSPLISFSLPPTDRLGLRAGRRVGFC